MFKKMFGGLLGGRTQPVEEILTFEQRRKTARRPCSLEVECRVGRSDIQAHVVDMGVGGLRIHFSEPTKLKQKSVVKVTYFDYDAKNQVQTIDCLTKWTRIRASDGSQFAGVEFKDPKGLGRSWVKPKMQEIGFRPYNIKEQRNDYRVVCNLKGTVNLGGTVLPCRVKNIGLGGLFVKLSKPIRAGATVEINVVDNADFPNQTFKATIRHQEHPEPTSPWGYGLAFQATSAQQADAIRAFIQERKLKQWDALRADTADEYDDYAIYAEAAEDTEQGASANDDIEIPSLDSILEETEPEEEEEELDEPPEEEEEA
jgi:PilZ domain-containing protein